MEWNVLNSEDQFREILEKSKQTPQVIFKHSSRCSISSMIRNRLERAVTPPNIDFNFLDLIAFRVLSNKIAETLEVEHESPQVLLIQDGKCIYHESHYGIHMEDIASHLV